MNWILFVSQILTASWVPIGPFGGSAEAIVVDPADQNVLLAAARSGSLYRSQNAGERWEPLRFRAPGQVHVLAAAASSPTAYYLGAGNDGLYRSTDSGDSWTKLEGLRDQSVLSIAVWKNDPKVIAAGCDHGLYMTRDGGDHWDRISSPANAEMLTITAVAIDPENADTIYAGTPHLPWKTTTGGKTWKPIHTGMIDDSDVFSISIDGNDPKHILASACSGIYSSRNRGETWTKVLGIPRTSRRTYVIRRDPHNPDSVYAGTSHSLWKSGRYDWREISPHIVKSIAFDSKRAYFATEDAGLMTSSDGGANLTPINQGFVNLNLTPLEGGGEEIYTSTLYQNPENSLYRLDANQASWKGLGYPENLLFLAPVNPKVMFGASYDSVFKSVDQGRSWVRVWKGDSVRALRILRSEPPQVLIGTDGGLLRSSDLGVHWTGVKSTQRITAISSSSDESLAVIEANGELLTSEDGANWTPIAKPVPSENLYGIAAGPSHVLLAATTTGAFRLQDLSGQWERVLNGGTVRTVYFAPESNEAFSVRSGVVLRSKDTGRTWTPLDMTGIDGSAIRSLAVSSGRLFAQTQWQGVFVTTLPGAITTGSYPFIRDPHGLQREPYVSLQAERD